MSLSLTSIHLIWFLRTHSHSSSHDHQQPTISITIRKRLINLVFPSQMTLTSIRNLIISNVYFSLCIVFYASLRKDNNKKSMEGGCLRLLKCDGQYFVSWSICDTLFVMWACVILFGVTANNPPFPISSWWWLITYHRHICHKK